jgi:adenylate kinase family enzyme
MTTLKTEVERLVVIGIRRAGKTTFARPLTRLLNVPHVELDTLCWQPSSVPKPPEELRALTAQALSRDCWVTDGNYGVVRDFVWSRATTVIWLNYAFRIVLWRALTRTLRRTATREQLFAGNHESLRMAFLSRGSILWWVLTTFHRRRKQYRELVDTTMFPQLSYVEFQKPSEAQRFLI